MSNGALLDDSEILLPSYGHITVRVTYTATDVGEFKYNLVVQNSVDANNKEEIQIHTEVTPSHRSEGIIHVHP